MLVVPDLITAFTSRRLIAISDGNLDPFYAATVMTTLVCLGLSLRSYLAPKSEVITPFGGLVFMALLTTVLVAVDATIYSAHLDEYPCGLEWGEWLLRQIIASQIPLLFASMVYGLSTTSSLHTWINCGEQRSCVSGAYTDMGGYPLPDMVDARNPLSQ